MSTSVLGQVDTLFQINGDQLLVDVTEITESSIKYVFPNESLTNTINKESVSKIHFKSGRQQTFTSQLNVATIKSCLDWEKVQISNLESEVQALQKISNVGAKAKGMTTLSSISKLQDRAFDKIKMATAMLGGNVAYVMDQNTEEAVYGGRYGSTKLPSVAISALAYTNQKVDQNKITYGDYKLSQVYELKTNSYTIDEVPISEQAVELNNANVVNDNGCHTFKMSISSVPKVKDFVLIHADDAQLVLSGVYTTRKGKTTYYNVILIKG